MKILTFEKDKDEGPAYLSEKTIKVGKLLEYLLETKDESLVKTDKIDRLEIYDKTFVKLYFKDNTMSIFDYNSIEWLRTHHFMHKGKYAKEEAEKLFDLIEGTFDWFVIEDWIIKNKTQYGRDLAYYKKEPEGTYDKDFIYVKGKNTGLKTSADMLVFVNSNKQNWY